MGPEAEAVKNNPLEFLLGPPVPVLYVVISYRTLVYFSIAAAVGICLHIYCGAIRTSDQERDLNSASRLRLNSCIVFDFTPIGLYISHRHSRGNRERRGI